MLSALIGQKGGKMRENYGFGAAFCFAVMLIAIIFGSIPTQSFAFMVTMVLAAQFSAAGGLTFFAAYLSFWCTTNLERGLKHLDPRDVQVIGYRSNAPQKSDE